MAHKKGQGSVKNGRDSISKRLGLKKNDKQYVKAGNIIIDGVNKHLYKYALKMTVDNLKIVFGELEENAGIKGAGALVINNEGL